MGILPFGTKVKTFYTRNWTPHHTIEADLVVELHVYACSKKKIAGGRGIPNSVKPQRKNRQIQQNHAKNHRAKNKKFRLFINATMSEFKTTIT